jgi:hypothetical protein
MEEWIDPVTQETGRGPAYALRLAAESMEENSPDIFRGIMLRIPRDHFENLHNSITIFRLICDSLVAKRQNLAIRPRPTLADRRKWDIAWRVGAAKCQKLSSFLYKRIFPLRGWHATPAMWSICDYARDRDLSMLVHSIIPPPKEGKLWFRIFKNREAGRRGRWTWQ